MQVFQSQPIERFARPLLGIVDEVVSSNHPGRVRFDNTIWFAQVYSPGIWISLRPDEIVWIIARQGNTLLVLPDPIHVLPTDVVTSHLATSSVKASFILKLGKLRISF